jgi:hypothetical protein
MTHGESISPTATAAEMQQVAAWLATAISDKQDVVNPVVYASFPMKSCPNFCSTAAHNTDVYNILCWQVYFSINLPINFYCFLFPNLFASPVSYLFAR